MVSPHSHSLSEVQFIISVVPGTGPGLDVGPTVGPFVGPDVGPGPGWKVDYFYEKKQDPINAFTFSRHIWSAILIFWYSMYTLLTLSDVGRGGQKGNKSEFFQKFSCWKVHFPRGLMDNALDFDTKGP